MMSKRKGNSLAAMEVTRQILGDKNIADLTDEEYKDYLKEFKSRGYSEKSVPKKWDGTPFRQGSRKGGPTHDQVYDLMEFISEPYIVTDKYFDGYNKDLNDLTSDELEKLFQELKQRFPEEHKEYVDSLNDAYLGSRSGSRKGQDFTSQGINNVANAFKDITTNKIPNAIGNITGKREGSRLGYSKDEYINWFYDYLKP